MNQTTVLIQRKIDPEPALQFKTPPPFGDLVHMLIVEGGMKSGATSIAFHIVLPDGKSIMCQTSAAIFQGLSDAFRGAEAYFKMSDLEKEGIPDGFGISPRPGTIDNATANMKPCPNDPEKKGSCIHCEKMVGGCPHRK